MPNLPIRLPSGEPAPPRRQSRPDLVFGFPRPLTTFVGREREIAMVHALLTRDDVQLLTLTGPGGVGKTRLALTVADLGDEFPDGIWFVALASIRDPALVAPTIARALDVPRNPAHSASKYLTDTLQDKRILLILDNFEQVLDASHLIVNLLAHCSMLKLLVTSRSNLRVSGEHVFSVPSLDLPNTDEHLDLNTTRSIESVRLFVERARAISAHFDLTTGNARATAEICQRLDGLPLGIELAAARLSALSPQDLLDRLDARLELLENGPRDQPGRLRSLRVSIAWSYDLLSSRDQVLFRRLGAFRGPWTLAAAEAVVNDWRDDPALSVVDGVASLVEKSLVRHQIMPDGTSQYQLLETIREFATELLDTSDEAGAVRDRLTGYLVSLIDGLVLSWDLPGGAERCALAEVHLTDLWAALARTERQADVEALGALAGSLAILQMRGHYHDSRYWLERAVKMGRAAGSPTLGRVMVSLAHNVHTAGDEETAWDLCVEALRLVEEQGDAPYQLLTLSECGIIARRRDEVEVAEEYHRRGLELLATMPKTSWLPYVECDARSELAYTEIQFGKFAAAREELNHALSIQAELGHEPGTGYLAAHHVLAGLGDVARSDGDQAAALQYHQRALQRAHATNDFRGSLYALGGIAASLACAGQWRLAARLFGADEQLHTRKGMDFDLATMDRQRSLGLPEPWFRGDASFGSGRRIREALWNESAPPYPPIPDQTEANALWAKGRTLTLDEAVTEALAATLTSESINDRWHGLSPREVEVLRLIVAGMTDQQIADQLFISRRTAATHIAHIYTKLDVSSRAEAAATAVRIGLA